MNVYEVMMLAELMKDYNGMVEEEDELYKGIQVCEECTEHVIGLHRRKSRIHSHPDCRSHPFGDPFDYGGFANRTAAFAN
ncbi:hypothetical protein D3C75_648690 [compost metagenome]